MADGNGYGVVPGGRGFPPVEVYRAIKMAIFDVDGVLTDGRIVVDANGVESKFFNVRDGSGIAFLHRAEVAVALLTGRSSPVVDIRARDLHIPAALVKQGVPIKLPAFTRLLEENGLAASQVAFVGDDIVDLPVLERVGLACCPADAHAEVAAISHVIARRSGGHGGVREICEHLLRHRADGSWEKAVNRYLGRA